MKKRRIFKILFVLTILGVLSALFIVISGLIEDDSHKDIALVLGNKVNEDGAAGCAP